MNPEPKPLVPGTNKRKYTKPILRVYGTVGEITANVSAMTMSDGASTAAMSATH